MALFSAAMISRFRCSAIRTAAATFRPRIGSNIRPPAALLPLLQHGLQARSHMNHGAPGGHDHHSSDPRSQPGVRKPVSLGLEAAQSTSNILRLLETSHGGYLPSDALTSVWHSQGLLWEQDDLDQKWIARNPTTATSTTSTDTSTPEAAKAKQAPQLLSISLSDDRTALVKLVGVDGRTRFISLLRLDAEFMTSGKGMGMGMGVPNDGWLILREVIANSDHTTNNTTSMESLNETIRHYLSIEHGGGPDDKATAQQLFHPEASLLTIGTQAKDSSTDDASEWNGPVGSLVEISLNTYLQGVASQNPHEDASKIHDNIWTLDLLEGGTLAAAAVQVGNGAQTTLFYDYLLLGRSSLSSSDWQILSKIFSPRAWK